MMWSSVPNVRSGMRTFSFSSLSIWKACGVVTSWMRCRPTRSWVWPDGSVRTVCASHTLSSSVRAMEILRPRIVPHRDHLVQRSVLRHTQHSMATQGDPVKIPAGTMVETALGPVATAELGPTLMHEHIVTRSPGVHENWPHLFDRDAVLAT